MRRVPLLSGSRVVLVPAEEDDVVLRPPPEPRQVVDVPGAVRDALRYPLSGPPLAALAPRNGRATIVVEPPSLPLPGVPHDPRQSAIATAIDELESCGIPDERQTILVAGGLGRRFGQGDLERILTPTPARGFRGKVVVHDAEDDALVALGGGARVDRALVETDLVLAVTAAETIVHGGPGALVAACDAPTVRAAAGADSLLDAAGSPVWRLALGVETAVAERVGLIGVSLVLDLPRLTGRYRDYPTEIAAVRRVAGSPLRRAFGLLPDALRRDVLGRLGRRLSATGAFAGPPSVAHAEALLRGVARRGTRIEGPVDALVVGAPWTGPHAPREQPNPITTASVALGLTLRLWRDAFPVREGGTLVLVHPLTRAFEHGTQDPYASLFAALRELAAPEQLAAAEREAAADARMLDAYRRGRACHPLLPYADWAGCAPALSRLGQVLVAGSRDAVAARALGFVPSHGIGSALEMAHGVAGGRARVGILLSPPYAPLLVG